MEREGEGVRVGGEEGASAGTMGGREGVWRVEGGGGLLTAGGLCSMLGHWVLGSSSPQEKSGSESVDSCYPCSSAKHKHHTCTYVHHQKAHFLFLHNYSIIYLMPGHILWS